MLAFFLVVAPGCSAGGDKRNAAAAQISKAEISSRFASAFCDDIAACCQSSGYAYDAATCKQTAAAYIDATIAKNATLAIAYDAEAAARCVEALAARPCVTADVSQVSLDACDDMFMPLLGPGATCADSSECEHPRGAPGDCALDPNTGTTPTRCALVTVPASPVRGKGGDACDATCTAAACIPPASAPTTQPPYASCYTAEGLLCDPSTSTCQALPKVGEACQTSCTADAFCDYTAGTCMPKDADGVPCTSASKCLSGGCENGNCAVDTIASIDACAGVPN